MTRMLYELLEPTMRRVGERAAVGCETNSTVLQAPRIPTAPISK
jgi:hypothetical protein